MRVRQTTTGAFSVGVNRQNYVKPNCASGYAFSHNGGTQYVGQVRIKRIEDCVTAGYHSLLEQKGFLPLNPVRISTTTETRNTSELPGRLYGDWSSTCNAYMTYAEGPSWALLTPRLAVLPPIEDNILASVANAAIANCKSSLFDALTAMAELQETIDLVKTQYQRVNHYAEQAARYARKVYDIYYRKARRKPPVERRRRALSAQAKAFANKWLEYRYGWLPAIYSVQDLLKALESELAKNSLVKGKATHTVNLAESGSDTLTFTGQTVSYSDLLYGTRTYRGVAYAKIVNTTKFAYGFDSQATFWERKKFSFVWDWFWDVGNWLKAWSPITGTELLGSAVSVKDSYTLKQSYSQQGTGGTSADDLEGFVRNNDSTVLVVETYERFPMGASALPNWNPRLNSVRLLDLISLLIGSKAAIARIMR